MKGKMDKRFYIHTWRRRGMNGKTLLTLCSLSVFLLSPIDMKPVAAGMQPQTEPHRGVRLDGVVAVVGGDAITQGEVDRWVYSAPARPEKPVDRAEVLRRLVDKKVVLKEAERRGFRPTEADIDAALDDVQRRNGLPDRQALKNVITAEGVVLWDDYLDDIRYQMTLLRLSGEKLAEVGVTQEEARRDYDAHLDRWMTEEEVHLDQLLFRDPGGPVRAGAAMQSLENGMPFESLAQAHGAEATDLGRLKLADLSPEIQAAMPALPVGGISPPIPTDGGVRRFRVRERFAPQPRTFEEVEPRVHQRLLSEKQAAAQAAWLAELRQTIHVEIRDGVSR
jgi:parvulin-like peptidyl-prolyl isomerase